MDGCGDGDQDTLRANTLSGDILSRRQVLWASGMAVVVTTSVGGCGLFSTEPVSDEGESDAEADGAREAPALADQVTDGTLPPIEERLPRKPVVVEPTEQVGRYGGTWRTAMLGAADTSWLGRTIGHEPLLRWDPAWTQVVPNVAEAWEVEDDGRAYVFGLREGMRWSDGEPLTADDVVFAIEDVLLDPELTPVFPVDLTDSGGRPPAVERVDDYTVRLTFQTPAGLLPERIAGTSSGQSLAYPRHYLEQFHLKYNADADSLAADDGFSSWTELFLTRLDPWANPELPRFHAWTPTTPLGEGTQLVAERNPYYWKVDPDGRQLPYLDQVVYDIVSDDEVLLLKATNGELDMHTRHINSLPNKPVLARNRDAGGFDFIEVTPALENEMVIFLNLAHSEPDMREVFQDRDFRIALSHAIDRQTLIDAAFQRQGKPWQVAPRPESAFYDEEFATQFLEHDPDIANEYLDRAGYTERDDDGFRLRPNGERISFRVEIATPALVPYWVDAMTLVVDDWKAVGVDASIEPEDRALFTERHAANQHDASVWTGFGGLTVDALLAPRGYFPMHAAGSRFAVPWAEWFVSGGDAGEEPPEPTRRQMELYLRVSETIDEAERNELFKQILGISKEQFYVIGTVLATDGYGIVTNDFRNVPASMPESHIYSTPGPTNPEQYFVASE